MNFKKVMAVAVVASVGVSLQCVAALTSKQDKLSYAMGYEAGKSFANHKMNINPKVFSAALIDAIKGRQPQMTESQIKETLVAYQKEIMQKFQAKMAKEANQNSQQEVKFLAKNAKVDGIKTTASGLQYRIINSGVGNSPAKTDSVTVNYEGSLLNGKIFDSSYKRGKPVTFQVKRVIPGWQQALELMKPGATWELFIPSKLAYGKMGIPGSIPPNSLLKFKVNLIKVNQKKRG